MSDVAAYLARLGIPEPGPPSAEGLRALHAAHVGRVAYETLDIQIGRPPGIEPAASLERVARRRRGGYCYHLNGAFSVLLGALGYTVTRHRAGVHGARGTEPPGPDIANHLTLTVSGLPAPECPDGTWLVDVGLGDALHEPIPLRAGRYAQGPFAYTLRPSEVEPGGWRLDHDARGSFAGMDFRAGPAAMEEFAARHAYLSTDPASGFVRVSTVQRRDATGVDALTGLVLSRTGTGPRASRVLDTRPEWFAAIDAVFGLPLRDLDAGARDALWARVHGAHEAWLAGTAA